VAARLRDPARVCEPPTEHWLQFASPKLCSVMHCAQISTAKSETGSQAVSATYAAVIRGLSTTMWSPSLNQCNVQLLGHASTATDRNTRLSPGLCSTTDFSCDRMMYGLADITQHRQTVMRTSKCFIIFDCVIMTSRWQQWKAQHI